jgi:hypothetical protein
MKKFILYLSLFYTPIIVVQAQYQSIFGDQQTVYLHNAHIPNTGNQIICTPDSVFISYGQDTTFFGKVFKPIKNSQMKAIAYVSEDTTTGEIFCRGDQWDTTLKKVMQMNLTAKDSFDLSFLGVGKVAVDSIYFQGGRKMIRLEYTERITVDVNPYRTENIPYVMIEGVGVNLFGLYTDYNTSYILKKQFHNGKLAFYNLADSSVFCDRLTGIKSRQLENIEIGLYPNPVSNRLYIKTDKVNIERMEILNLEGKVLLDQAFLNSIDVSSFDTGIYLLKLYHQGRVINKKFQLR